jgi:hypothetical protein
MRASTRTPSSRLSIVPVDVSTAIPLSLGLAVVGGLGGAVFVGLSRTMAVWAAAFVGLLPLGALITAGLAAWLGPAVRSWSTRS